MHYVEQVAGGIAAHSMSRLLKPICSMSVLMFVFFEILYSGFPFLTLSIHASFACPFCPSVRIIWYSVLDVIQKFTLEMGLSSDCQHDLCTGAILYSPRTLLGNTVHCVTDRFVCPWPHFAC